MVIDDSSPILRPPKDWLADSDRVIVDCDGWTREEWQAQQPITHDEFLRRLNECTSAPKVRP